MNVYMVAWFSLNRLQTLHRSDDLSPSLTKTHSGITFRRVGEHYKLTLYLLSEVCGSKIVSEKYIKIAIFLMIRWYVAYTVMKNMSGAFHGISLEKQITHQYVEKELPHFKLISSLTLAWQRICFPDIYSLTLAWLIVSVTSLLLTL